MICVACGYTRDDNEPICPYHFEMRDDTWPVINKLMCDLLHRGVDVPYTAEPVAPGEA